MTTTNNRLLISRSVAAIRIGVHPTRLEPDRHVVRVAPCVSRTITIREISTKSNLGHCSQDEVLPPAIIRPGCHPGLPHSLSNKPPRNREV
jgi:hypothetical protein